MYLFIGKILTFGGIQERIPGGYASFVMLDFYFFLKSESRVRF
jgi:hypothetical protein